MPSPRVYILKFTLLPSVHHGIVDNMATCSIRWWVQCTTIDAQWRRSRTCSIAMDVENEKGEVDRASTTLLSMHHHLLCVYIHVLVCMCVAMLVCVSGSCDFQPSKQIDPMGHGHRQQSTVLVCVERERHQDKDNICCFQVVTHPSTEQAQQIRRELVYSMTLWYGRRH